ncbi:MAG: Hsp20/alpha crystallin family protein [Bacteroidota bacterium]
MSNEQRPEDLFENLKDGFSSFGKKVGDFVDDVLSGEGIGKEINVRVDIYQEGDQFVIDFEIPGVTKKEINLQVYEGVLTVKGEKKRLTQLPAEQHIRQERKFGYFVRNIQLPIDVELDGIKATYEAGVLSVRFPRAAGADDNSQNINIE